MMEMKLKLTTVIVYLLIKLTICKLFNPNNFMQQQPQFQQPMMNMNNSIPTETPEGKISWNSVFPNNNTSMFNQPQTIQTGSGRIECVQSI